MKTRIIYHLTFLFCLAILLACGKEPAPQTISITGTVSGEAITSHPDKNVMVIAIKGENLLNLSMDALSNPSTSMEDLVEFISIDKATMSFHMDLTDKDVKEGDELAFIAFVDVNDSSSLPLPNKGDYLGFYIDEEEMAFTYKLKKGENRGLNIPITREIFDFDASIEGTITGEDMGDMMIIAYAGVIDSLDFSSAIDFDGVVGIAQIEKTEETQEFTLDILPFLGKNVPIEDVFLIAFLDKNGNGKPDGGDVVGFLSTEDKLPAMITVEEGVMVLADKEIELSMELTDPSGYDVPLKGTIEMPNGEYFHKNSPPIYVVLVSADSLTSFTSFSEDMIGTLKYFKKLTSTLPPDEGERYVDFQLDLSNSSLKAGDDVMVAAFWDKDYVKGFPNPSAGDRFGFYNNKDDFTFAVTLLSKEEASETVVPHLGADEFKLNKIWYEHNTSIKYRFDENALAGNYEIGDKIMVAAFQKDGLAVDWLNLINPFISIEYSVSIDIDYLVGAQMVDIDEETFESYQYFTLDLLPFQLEGLVGEPGFDIDDVGIFAVYGMEGFELFSDGDYKMGYYYQLIGTPLFFDISEGPNTPTYMATRGVRFFNVSP